MVDLADITIQLNINFKLKFKHQSSTLSQQNPPALAELGSAQPQLVLLLFLVYYVLLVNQGTTAKIKLNNLGCCQVVFDVIKFFF